MEKKVKYCIYCGGANTDDAIFCGNCGKRLEEKESFELRIEDKGGGKKTVLMSSGATVFKLIKDESGIGEKKKEGNEEESKGKEGSKTILGVISPLKFDIREQEQIPDDSSPKERSSSKIEELGKKTIFDPIPAPQKFLEEVKKENKREEELKRPDQAGLTMLGMPAYVVKSKEELSYTTSLEQEEEKIKKSFPHISIIIGVIIFFLFVTVILITYFGFMNKQSTIPISSANVQFLSDKRKILLTVKFGTDNLKYIFFDKEKVKVENKVAKIIIPLERLKLGKNLFPLKIVTKDNNTIAQDFEVIIAHQTKVVLSGLTHQPPYYFIEFKVVPGSILYLPEKEVKVSNGHYQYKRSLKVDSNRGEGGFVTDIVAFKVKTPDSLIENDVVKTNIPFTPIQLLAPGEESITDTGKVLFYGKGLPKTKLIIIGERGTKEIITDSQGIFKTEYLLTKQGENNFIVKGVADNHLPTTLNLKVNFIKDPLKKLKLNRYEELDFKYIIPSLSNNWVNKNIYLSGELLTVKYKEGRCYIELLSKCHISDGCITVVEYNPSTLYSKGMKLKVWGKIVSRKSIKTVTEKSLEVPFIKADYIRIIR